MQSSATDPGALPETGAISSASGHVREVRRLLQEATRSTVAATQRSFLLDAADRMVNLKHLAKPAELQPLRQMAFRFEGH